MAITIKTLLFILFVIAPPIVLLVVFGMAGIPWWHTLLLALLFIVVYTSEWGMAKYYKSHKETINKFVNRSV